MKPIRKLKRWLTGASESKETADQAMYRGRDYLEAYAAHTDVRVGRDPQKAVGGDWEELGQLQFDFLVREGLKPGHQLLDIGCGTLRGGRFFIAYLDAGHYTGIDISPEALAYGAELIREAKLTDKTPRLLLNEAKELTFTEVGEHSFDYLLAQSVFTHLMPEHIETCFANLSKVMGPSARFYFTYWERPTYQQLGAKTTAFPQSFFEELAARHRYRVADRSADYPHPKGQRMLCLSNEQH